MDRCVSGPDSLVVAAAARMDLTLQPRRPLPMPGPCLPGGAGAGASSWGTVPKAPAVLGLAPPPPGAGMSLSCRYLRVWVSNFFMITIG